MSLRKSAWLILGAGLVTVLYGFQQPWRLYRSMEPYDNVPLPPDWDSKAEWIFARLMYPQHPHARYGRYFGRQNGLARRGNQLESGLPARGPASCAALRRLTRIDVRSLEQPVNLDDGDDVYNWPFLCAGEMGDWKLTDSQITKLRDYLLRGGFLLLDDFWGTEEWERFYETMRLVFPDRPVVEIEDTDSIFHTVYDLDDRYQVPGEWALRRGTTYRNDGAVAHWRGIYDDHGRLLVAMSFNNDLGDSWEWADDPAIRKNTPPWESASASTTWSIR